MAAWTWRPSPWWLPASALVVLTGIAADRRRRRPTRSLGLVLLLLAVPVAFLAHYRLARVAEDWDGYWDRRESEVFVELTDALEALVTRGDDAVRELAALAGSSPGHPDRREVEALRERTGFAAVAIYDPDGRPRSWSGTHRGRVPEDVQQGVAPYLYGELPLFSYLYFTELVPETGGTAVVAALVRSDLPEDLEARPGDFVAGFRRGVGEEIRIARSERAGDRAAFDFVWHTAVGPDTLFSVSVVRPVEMERRAGLRRGWVRLLVVVVLVAWLALAISGRGTVDARRAVVTLALLALLLPLDVLGADDWYRAADFHFALGPIGASLGRVLVVLLVGVAGLALWRGGTRARFAVPVAGLGVAVLYPGLVYVLSRSASAGFLAGPESGWISFQIVLSVALSLVAGAALALARPSSREGGGGARFAMGLLVALALSAAVAWYGGGTRGSSPWNVAAWALPVMLVASGLDPWKGWRRSILVWSAATVLGTSAALPMAWHARTSARISIAEEQIRRLGAEVDPYLDFLLGRLARSVASLRTGGAGPVEILYRGWLESGLAEEGYPVWLTLWGPGGLPQEEFPIGVVGPRPAVTGRFAAEARLADSVAVRRFRLADLHYLVTVPLADGSVVTGAVPPLREIRSGSSLGPLFGSLSGDAEDPLTLVPLLPGDAPTHGRVLDWRRTEVGWQGEMLLTYPDQRYNAHYLVDLSGPLALTARATLLLVLNLGIMLLVWASVRAILLGGRPGPADIRPLLGSFRARVTLALFAFFLLSNAIFGTLAYRTISGAAERAARVLAERVVRDGAAIYNQVGGQMELLARQVGADLLEFRDGELLEGSSEELVELGLFEGWLPWDVDQLLTARQDVMATREERLGRWEYVTAFRRLPDGDILAAPVPLQAGATAVRREEVAHLLGFAVVAGALLSLVLALLVGRTLARPIRTLQVASERVGAGNLGVRLPGDRSDEFGAVFGAFNRMVRRLRRARRALVRTTRRTEAIVEDAATGVIALDSSGRTTLANPRAGELLGRSVAVGERLREDGTPADEFVRWVKLYFRDGLRELGGEFQFGERRVRVRARRIEREGSQGGAVVSLEDVTDELRTERVLAWGEMARQVAHEVKNPLTPIKLAIQHIRRAWDDRRPDFDEILTRNADAALGEIDRLATIASSFSRFGAPEAAGAAPLGPVRLHAVVGEVMALYQSGEGGVRFDTAVSADLPAVRARATEMKEVLVNLLENSRAAIEDEGVVRVRAVEAGDTVVLDVQDDGGGISTDLLPRVFEPHFSTRSAGTGLGLAIVKRLVESWEATVAVESEPGQGTVVRIYLEAWRDGDRPGPREGASRGGV